MRPLAPWPHAEPQIDPPETGQHVAPDPGAGMVRLPVRFGRQRRAPGWGGGHGRRRWIQRGSRRAPAAAVARVVPAAAPAARAAAGRRQRATGGSGGRGAAARWHRQRAAPAAPAAAAARGMTDAAPADTARPPTRWRSPIPARTGDAPSVMRPDAMGAACATGGNYAFTVRPFGSSQKGDVHRLLHRHPQPRAHQQRHRAVGRPEVPARRLPGHRSLRHQRQPRRPQRRRLQHRWCRSSTR